LQARDEVAACADVLSWRQPQPEVEQAT
jgi:hypothetical protein